MRDDGVIRAAIGNEMPPTMLLETGKKLLAYAKELDTRFDGASTPRGWSDLIGWSAKAAKAPETKEESDAGELDDQCTEALDGLVAFNYLFRCLLETSIFEAGAASLVPPDMSEFIDDVEIMKDGLIEPVTFRLSRELKVSPSPGSCVMSDPSPDIISPPLSRMHTQYLSEDVKIDFLDRCDLSTVEKRMSQMCVEEVDMLMAQTHQKYTLAGRSQLYKFINTYFVEIKLCMYALVVLLNLNVIMASYSSEKSTSQIPGYSSAWEALFNQETEGGKFDPLYTNSLMLTWVLGLVNLMGYIIITGFLALTEIPVIVEQTRNFMEDHDPEEPSRNPSAWNAYVVTALFILLFIIMHVFNCTPHSFPRPLPMLNRLTPFILIVS